MCDVVRMRQSRQHVSGCVREMICCVGVVVVQLCATCLLDGGVFVLVLVVWLC